MAVFSEERGKGFAPPGDFSASHLLHSFIIKSSALCFQRLQLREAFSVGGCSER